MSDNQTDDEPEPMTTYAENARKMRESDNEDPREHGFIRASDLVPNAEDDEGADESEAPGGKGYLGRCSGCRSEQMLYPENDYKCASCVDGGSR